MADFSALDQLVDIITSGVTEIKRAYMNAGIAAPRLDEPWAPTPVDEEINTPALLVSSAATQLVALLRDPHQLLFEAVWGMPYHSAGIVAVQKLHIPELIREGGVQGRSVDDLGKITKTDPQRLVRILRHLATRHVFQEVTPGVYAHNRISSMLDTGVSYESITKDPLSKFNDGGNSKFAAHIEAGEDFISAAAILPELMSRPGWSFTDDIQNAPIAHALHPGLELPPSLFESFMLPEFSLRRARFNAAMAGHSDVDLFRGYPWAELPPGSLVVDVGGGVGGSALAILRKHPHLRFVVQDLAIVVENEGRKFWAREHPEAMADRRVILQGHDLFAPQPAQATPVAVFLLRCISHDWNTSAMRNMLRALVAGATPHTRVVIIDNVVPYTSKISITSEIPCDPAFKPPAPLLSSAGNEGVFDRDMILMGGCNAFERTAEEFVDMCTGTGWRIEQIYRSPPGGMSHVILMMYS